MKIGIASPVLIRSLKEHLYAPDEYMEYGRGGTAVNSVIDGLLKLGHTVSVYTLDDKVEESLKLKGSNLTIFFGKYRRKPRYQMLDNFHFESKQIRDFIIDDMPDIVHANWSYEYAMGALMSKRPHLITFRDESVEILRYFKDLYRLNRLILDFRVRYTGKNFSVNSIYLQKKLGYFRKGLPVVPNPIRDELIAGAPKLRPDGEVRIISILTGWTKLKNPIPALKAFNELRSIHGKRVEYHIFGPGYAHNGEGFQWAKENGMLDGVYFYGPVAHSELLKKLRYFDILLHPSLEESFGNAIVEGMANGLPVIGGERSGAVPWVLNYGKNGLLVNVSSPDAICKALNRLITERALYERLSRDGLIHVRQNFSSSRIAREYVGLYNRILNVRHVSTKVDSTVTD